MSVTGIAQAPEKVKWLDGAYQALRELDAVWSRERNMNESVRLTTVKPSGTLSLLAGVTPGIHPAFSTYHIRRVRMAADDAVAEWCRSLGYPTEYVRGFDGVEDHSTIVVEFPCRFPEGTVTAPEMTATAQLDLARTIQTVWADNSVSATVYYEQGEVPIIREYLKEHWDMMKSISFLPRSDHGFDQAPLEPIEKGDYEARVAGVHPIRSMDTDTSRHALTDEECEGGMCPIR